MKFEQGLRKIVTIKWLVCVSKECGRNGTELYSIESIGQIAGMLTSAVYNS